MRILLLLLLLGLARPLAAEPVFLPGSSIGIEPPPGFVPSTSEAGFFEDPRTRGSLQLSEMPAIDYAELWRRLTSGLPPGGVETGRRTLRIAGGEALLVEAIRPGNPVTLRSWHLLFAESGIAGVVTVAIPEQTPIRATAAAVVAAMQTVVVRRSGLAEQRAALPYLFQETSGLRFQAAMLGDQAILVPPGVLAMAASPHVRPPSLSLSSTRTRFYRPRDPRVMAVARIRERLGYRDVTQVAESALSVAGLPGVRIEFRATRASDGSPWRIVQWMGFVPDHSSYVHALAEAPEASFDALAPEFEQVAASLRRR
jgi:hypothetical protein